MKLIICDMSGIASTRGINNDKLLDTLNNLKNYNCTFCTGKGYQGGYETLKNIDLKVPFICENGSVIVDKKGKVIYNDKMNYNKVKSLNGSTSNRKVKIGIIFKNDSGEETSLGVEM